MYDYFVLLNVHKKLKQLSILPSMYLTRQATIEDHTSIIAINTETNDEIDAKIAIKSVSCVLSYLSAKYHN